jgi:hypothetical protein
MSQSRRKYVEIPKWDRDKVDQALRDDDPNALRYAVLAVSMYDQDWRYAQDLCVQLSSHLNINVRGNAIQGFGHISRVHGQLDQFVVQPIIQAALSNAHKYVRGNASDAADETAHFLGWIYEHTDVG